MKKDTTRHEACPRRNQSGEPFRKKQGAICRSMIRCGKPGCKCARGELHGPYWYRFFRDGQGRLHRQYIRKADAEAAIREQEVSRREQQALRAFIRENLQAYRQMRRAARALLQPEHDLMKGDQ